MVTCRRRYVVFLCRYFLFWNISQNLSIICSSTEFLSTRKCISNRRQLLEPKWTLLTSLSIYLLAEQILFVLSLTQPRQSQFFLAWINLGYVSLSAKKTTCQYIIFSLGYSGFNVKEKKNKHTKDKDHWINRVPL